MPNQITVAFSVSIAGTSYGLAKAAAALDAVPLYANPDTDPVLGQFFGLTVASDTTGPEPASVFGTVALTPAVLAALNGTTFVITEGIPGTNMSTTFVGLVTPADVIAQLDATISGPPHTPFPDVYTAFINVLNQLVVNAGPTPLESFTVSGTALAVLGMTAGTYAPSDPVTRTLVLNMTSVPGVPTAPPPFPCNPITAVPPTLPYPLLKTKTLPGFFLTTPGLAIVGTSDSQVPSLVAGEVVQFLAQPGVFYTVSAPPTPFSITVNPPYSGPFSEDESAVVMVSAPASIAAIYSTSPLDSNGVAITPALPAGSGARTVSLSYLDSNGAGNTIVVPLMGTYPSLIALPASPAPGFNIATITDMHIVTVGGFGNSVGEITLCELSGPPPYVRPDADVEDFRDLTDQTQMLITRGLAYLPPSYFALSQQGQSEPSLLGVFTLPGRDAHAPNVQGGISIATTVNPALQTPPLVAGNVIEFAAQPGFLYTIKAVGGGANGGIITLTTPYTGLNDNPIASSATLVTPSPATPPATPQLSGALGEFVNPGTAVPPPNAPLAPQTMTPSPVFLSGLFARTLQLALAVPVVPSVIAVS